MGIEYLVFSRMPYDLQEDWKEHLKFEFIWKPKMLTSQSKSVFVHKTIGHYSAPGEYGLFNGGDAMRGDQRDLPNA